MSINTGLFSVLTNDDEIAVVLGHEMGHGQKDHPAKGARRSLNMSILGAATGTDLGVIVANVINNRNITKPMEREADALAFRARQRMHSSQRSSRSTMTPKKAARSSSRR